MVPTLHGEVKLKVPAGTQPNEKRVLRGKGIRKVNTKNSSGDQYVTFKVLVPKLRAVPSFPPQTGC